MSEANSEQVEAETPTRVLLIDDSKVMRKSAVKMLGGEFDVVVAEDGEQGWAMIREDASIHVVFTDLNMPKMNGYQVLEAVRTSGDEGIRNLPVIVVTGAENDDEAKEQALTKGATDFITKPFNSTDLKARAHAHASYRRTTQTLQQGAAVDGLTGLGNERSFLEQLEKDLSFVARHQNAISIMMLEVDHFNDLFLKIGRKGADNLLQQIAKVLTKSVRKEDGLGRIGLARFAISLPTAGEEGARHLAERICNTVSSFKATLRGEALNISISVGLFVPGEVDVNRRDYYLEQTALYLQEAIDAGGNQVRTGVEAGAEPAVGQDVTDFSLDALLDQLANQGADSILDQIPLALQRLLPLWQVLDADQKAAVQAQLSGI